MSKFRKVLAVLLVAALAVAMLAVAGCGTTPETETKTEEKAEAQYKLMTGGKLTVGSDLDYPPMEMLGADGKTPEGFDIDLMTAIADEMGLEINYLPPQKFDTLLASVNAGKFDVAASSITITDERKAEVVFTDPYFDSNQSLAMKTGSVYNSPADMNGKKIGVQSGTTGEAWATENLKPAGATIVPFSKTSEAFAALEAGNVDGVVNDLPVTAQIVKEKGGAFAIVKEIPTGEQYGFAVAKSNGALATAMNEALKKIKDSGELQKIYDKWIVTK